MTVLRVKRVGPVEVPLPAYHTRGSAGLDLCAALQGRRTLQPGERELIPTGFAIELPEGYEAQVRPRSGLALHHGVTVVNAPGTVDSDYRGEISVVLINHGNEPFVVEPGLRIAQLIVSPVQQVEVQLVDELGATARGAGGYGSTGA